MNNLFIDVNGVKFSLKEGKFYDFKSKTLQKTYYFCDVFANNPTFDFVKSMARQITEKFGVKNFIYYDGTYKAVAFLASDIE